MEVLRWGIPDSLPLGYHLVQGSHPFTGVCLQFHQGQSSGGRGSGSAEQGCLRAGSASISRLLQPVIHGYESFRGVETGHRPFHSELEDSADFLQDGDTSIRSSLGSSGGLDGVSGLEGCILAGANAPGFTQVPQVHGGGEGVPVQGTLLRPFHGSASFYQGHGSCVSDSTEDGGTTSSLPGRLVASGILTRAGSPCSEDSAPTLQAPRDCCQLGQVSSGSDSADGISGSHPGLPAFRASPALKRVEKLLSIDAVFLSCVSQPVSSWLELLGVLSSMIQLVPGGRLCKRSLQLTLWRQWDRIDQSQLVEWSPVIQDVLSWWRDRDRLVLGFSLEQVSPQLELWSDASDVGWGTHLDEQFASGLWAPEDVERSINARELLAIESALKWFAPLLAGSSVAVFADKLTAVSYMRNQGGTRSSFLNFIAQREDLSVVISPQFIMGKHNVLADAFSRPNQILGSEWTLKQWVFRYLWRRWPVLIGLFATSQNHRCSFYFSPYHIHNANGTDALLRIWNEWQAYAFLPWSLIPAGLQKLRSSSGVLLTIVAPYWHQRSWFPDLVVDGPVALPQSRDLMRQPHFHRFIWECPGCVFMLGDYQVVPCAGGFSRRVAQQVSLTRRPSSRAGYQSKWLVFRHGVHRKGIPFLTLPCLRLLIFCFGFDVTVDYQYLLLWAIGPCCLQFLNRFGRRFLYLRCFMFCCGHFRQRHQFGRFVLLPGI